MTGPTPDLIAAAAGVLEHTGSSEAEATATAGHIELTRYAANVIHQNVAESSLHLRARVISDHRVGVADLRGAVDGAAARVAAAAESARRIAAQTDVAPLPGPAGDAAEGGRVAYSARTAEATPEERADMVAAVVRPAAERNLRAYGFVSTQTTGTGIVNTRGLRRAATSTQASMVALVRGDHGSGYAARHAADVDDIDVAGLAAEAVDTCLRNQDAATVEPAVYEVVVSPYAVADLLGHLSWVGFSALAKQEHRSFMRFGERLMSDSITITDDSHTDELFPYPFDDEGVSTRIVGLIEAGVCANVVYDTPTALRDGVESTGHSLPQPNTWGPFPRHMLMDAGDRAVDELISQVRHGLYITRFWYVRDVHPLRTIITGMTRDGTFLIENGAITRPVADLRFTQSIVEALSDVRGVSRERLLELEEGESGVLSPWLHLGRFAFTS